MELFWPERLAHLERLPAFRARVDRLRRLAEGEDRGGYSASTGPLRLHPFSELEVLARTSHTIAKRDVPVWHRHVCDYVTGCRQAARQFLGHEALAARVHELVRGGGYRLTLPPLPVPTVAGAQASKAAAYFAQASWGAGEQANLHAWRRYRARAVAPLPFRFTRELI